MQEEARLLYVGMTRARDYLILPTRKKDAIWLNRVCNDGREDDQALDQHTDETPWNWDEQFLDKQTETFLFPADFPDRSISEETSSFPGSRIGRKRPIAGLKQDTGHGPHRILLFPYPG